MHIDNCVAGQLLPFSFSLATILHPFVPQFCICCMNVRTMVSFWTRQGRREKLAHGGGCGGGRGGGEVHGAIKVHRSKCIGRIGCFPSNVDGWFLRTTKGTVVLVVFLDFPMPLGCDCVAHAHVFQVAGCGGSHFLVNF